jgi:hypothetical protein
MTNAVNVNVVFISLQVYGYLRFLKWERKAEK